jgi:CBS domain-containing protein
MISEDNKPQMTRSKSLEFWLAVQLKKEIAMQVKEIMTKDLEVVRPDDTLQEAARKMKILDVGPLPVSEGDKVVGMLTDRDITVRATAEGLDPNRRASKTSCPRK